MIIDTEFRAIRDKLNGIINPEAVKNGMTMYGMEKEVKRALEEFNIDFTEKDFFIKWALELYVVCCETTQTVPTMGDILEC